MRSDNLWVYLVGSRDPRELCAEEGFEEVKM